MPTKTQVSSGVSKGPWHVSKHSSALYFEGLTVEMIKSSRFGGNKGGKGYAFLSLVFLLQVHWTDFVLEPWRR